MTVSRAKVDRNRILAIIYESTGGDRSKSIMVDALATKVGLDPDETWRLLSVLKAQGLVCLTSGSVGLTTAGVLAVEEPETPDSATRESTYIINIGGSMVDSSIQQGSQGATLHNTGNTQYLRQFQDFLNELTSALPTLASELPAAQQAHLEAEVSTAMAQVSSPRPNQKILGQCLTTIRSILEGVASNLVADQLLQRIPALFS